MQITVDKLLDNADLYGTLTPDGTVIIEAVKGKKHIGGGHFDSYAKITSDQISHAEELGQDGQYRLIEVGERDRYRTRASLEVLEGLLKDTHLNLRLKKRAADDDVVHQVPALVALSQLEYFITDPEDFTPEFFREAYANDYDRTIAEVARKLGLELSQNVQQQTLELDEVN